MEVKIKFRDSDARVVLGTLRKKYQSKAGMEKLVKRAIWSEVSEQLSQDVKEARKRYEEEAAQRRGE